MKMDSSILISTEKQSFLNIVIKNNLNVPFEWKLIYRATRDGFDTNGFHSKCNGVSNTLSLIQSDSTM